MYLVARASLYLLLVPFFAFQGQSSLKSLQSRLSQVTSICVGTLSKWNGSSMPQKYSRPSHEQSSPYGYSTTIYVSRNIPSSVPPPPLILQIRHYDYVDLWSSKPGFSSNKNLIIMGHCLLRNMAAYPFLSSSVSRTAKLLTGYLPLLVLHHRYAIVLRSLEALLW